jgi:hypothetical protein
MPDTLRAMASFLLSLTAATRHCYAHTESRSRHLATLTFSKHNDMRKMVGFAVERSPILWSM